jgi:citrate lyase subunit beta / citryl-CoA lyase
LFAKAMASAADGISLDLQDAVAADRKAEARAEVARFLASRPGGKRIIVRVNPLGSPHFAADMDAVLVPGLDMVNLPMVERGDDVREAAERIERTGLPITILANIETPRALRCAAEIAGAHRLVGGLQAGFGDLFEPFGIDRTETVAVRHVLMQVRLAAAEANVTAYDGAYANVADADGFREECRFAQRLGYAGKSCIHPSQVPFANECFRPDAASVAQARRVLDAAATAAANGVGAFMVDGRMVDGPFIESARALVAAAEQADGL